MTFPQLTIHPHRDAPEAHEGAAVNDEGADYERGSYLTDGVHLYRAVGTFGEASGLFGLEDCQSLDVILLRADELRGLRLVGHIDNRV